MRATRPQLEHCEEQWLVCLVWLQPYLQLFAVEVPAVIDIDLLEQRDDVRRISTHGERVSSGAHAAVGR